MSCQGTFDFVARLFRRRPQKPEYVFFGLLPVGSSTAIVRCRERIMVDQGIFGRCVGSERLHISLPGLGCFKHIPSWVPYGARLAADRISLPAFEVTLRRAATLQGGRPGRYPTVLLAEDERLQELADGLFRGLQSEGMKATGTSRPHMTLFYSPQRISPVDIAPIRIRIDRFHLIHSERGLSRYNILGSWPLVEPDGPLAFGSMAA